MSVHVSSRVWSNCEASLGSRLVMLALADFCNDDGECWPSNAMVAERCRLSTRQVIRILDALDEAGEITTQRGGHGRGDRPVYHLPRYVMEKGDNVSPKPSRKGDILSSNRAAPRVTSTTTKGDIRDSLRVTSATSHIEEPPIEPPIEPPMVVVVGPSVPELPRNDDDVAADQVFGALCGVMALDPEDLSLRQEQAIDELSRWCADRRVNAEDVHDWGDEWFEIMRRKTGKAAIDPPSCAQLRRHFASCLANVERKEAERELYANFVSR